MPRQAVGAGKTQKEAAPWTFRFKGQPTDT